MDKMDMKLCRFNEYVNKYCKCKFPVEIGLKFFSNNAILIPNGLLTFVIILKLQKLNIHLDIILVIPKEIANMSAITIQLFCKFVMLQHEIKVILIRILNIICI